MIRRIVIRRFKRFDEVTFDLPGHVVLAGPNNAGKTTVLQALAAWKVALSRWQALNDFRKYGNRSGTSSYHQAPIARPTFYSVPLRVFDLLWRDREDAAPIEIDVQLGDGRRVAMQIERSSTEQIHVRPSPETDVTAARDVRLDVVFVPAMTGLGIAEPVYKAPKVEQLLGQGKPGDVLRNLLVEAHNDEKAWSFLLESIARLFRCELIPPDDTGADIVADYRPVPGGPQFDIASAGSGFQQILMLLTFLHTRPASVLLLDEPDAHLHMILQDSIYGELRSVAARAGSQLIIATHSEAIIDSAEPREIYIILDRPRPLRDEAERERFKEVLKVLSHSEIVKAMEKPAVLYLEDYTDRDILREWARVLGHPAYAVLAGDLFWERGSTIPDTGKHFQMLTLVRDDLRGLDILDRDAKAYLPSTQVTAGGLQRIRWSRYEIESYLVHPAAIERFIEHKVGAAAAAEHVRAAREYMQRELPPAVLENPLSEHALLRDAKASAGILPGVLQAAFLPEVAKPDLYGIAAAMKPEEIHPEVREKLDAIVKVFAP
jgi:putative AbiEii toxin of type IV toxin-antitoxin system